MKCLLSFAKEDHPPAFPLRRTATISGHFMSVSFELRRDSLGLESISKLKLTQAIHLKPLSA